jgi:hypothetical protein
LQTCIPGGLGSRSIASLKKTFDFAVKFRYRCIEGFAPRIDDDGPLWAQLAELEAYSLANPSLNPISHDGLAECAGAGETNVRSFELRFPDTECRKEGAGKPGTLVVDSTEIFGTQQADTFRKTRDEDYLSSLTVSLWRPRARRRARTARPFLVSMRVRNPCVLARWRLFG